MLCEFALLGHGRTAPYGSKADEADGANEASLRRIIAVSCCWPELERSVCCFHEYELWNLWWGGSEHLWNALRVGAQL